MAIHVPIGSLKTRSGLEPSGGEGAEVRTSEKEMKKA